MKALLISILAVGALLGQQPRQMNSYMTTCVMALTSAAGVCTVQQPAAGSRIVQFDSVYIYSTVAATITQERNGTAATSTAGTVYKQPETDTSAALAWSASNVGVGTLLHAANAIAIPAASAIILDIADIQMRGDGTAKNYTVRSNSITGTITIIIKWREF